MSPAASANVRTGILPDRSKPAAMEVGKIHRHLKTGAPVAEIGGWLRQRRGDIGACPYGRSGASCRDRTDDPQFTKLLLCH